MHRVRYRCRFSRMQGKWQPLHSGEGRGGWRRGAQVLPHDLQAARGQERGRSRARTGAWAGPSMRWSDASVGWSICSASMYLPWSESTAARLPALLSVSGCSTPSTLSHRKHLRLAEDGLGLRVGVLVHALAYERDSQVQVIQVRTRQRARIRHPEHALLCIQHLRVAPDPRRERRRVHLDHRGRNPD